MNGPHREGQAVDWGSLVVWDVFTGAPHADKSSGIKHNRSPKIKIISN